MNLYRWSGKKGEKENRNHCPRFERETYTLVFPYIFHGKLEAMIRNRATCLTSSTLSPNSKDFTSALNKLWNVPPPRSLASFFCSPPPSTPLPTRGLYILEFCKRKNTPRDTIRNGSVIDTFLFFFLFFYLEKRIVKNSNTRGENENWNLIKYALLLLVLFSPKKISRPKKCVENTNI